MKKSLFFTVVFLIGLKCSATHLRGGEIYAERISPNSLRFRVTVKVFTNTTNTNVLFGGEEDWLDFGDGQRILIPETPNTLRPDLGEGVAVASFTIDHTYANPSSYRITYSEPNWEEGIINFDGSINTRFYLETTINALPGYIASPKIILEHSVFGILGEPFSLALTAKDSNDYKLIYTLEVPKMSSGMNVVNYRLPEGASINAHNGLFEWDTKFNGEYLRGAYLFSVKVSQYDVDDRVVGSIVRNFVIILDEENVISFFHAPENLNEDKAIVVSPGTQRTFRFAAGAMDAFTKLEIKSELTQTQGALEIESYDTTINDQPMKAKKLVFNSLPTVDRKNPYAIVVRAKYYYTFHDVVSQDFVILICTQSLPEDIEEPVTGIDREHSPRNFAFPNPVSTTLYFDDFASNRIVRVVDMSGRIVLIKEKDQKSVDVSALSPGSYFAIPEQPQARTQLIIKH